MLKFITNLLPKNTILLACMVICTTLLVSGLQYTFIRPLRKLKTEYIQYKEFAKIEIVKLKSTIRVLEVNLTTCQESNKFNSLVTQRDLMYNNINNFYHDIDESVDINKPPKEGNFTLRL